MKKQFLVLSLALFAACQPAAPIIHQVLAPEPAKIIAGTYTAKTTSSFSTLESYPINGKTMTLQIDRVSADTVRVHLQAPANGFYSPARDTTYANVYVLTKPQGYYLTLEPPIHPGAAENQLSITSGSALYTFVPPGYTTGTVGTLFMKSN